MIKAQLIPKTVRTSCNHLSCPNLAIWEVWQVPLTGDATISFLCNHHKEAAFKRDREANDKPPT